MGVGHTNARRRGGKEEEQEETPQLDIPELAALPEGAVQEIGVLSIGATVHESIAATLVSMAANTAVLDEIAALEAGSQKALQEQDHKNNFDSWSDARKGAWKLQRDEEGGGSDSTGPPPAEGESPPGFASPGEVVAFHAQRAVEYQALSSVWTSLVGSTMQVAATPNLDEQSIATLSAMATAYQEEANKTMQVSGAYMAVSGSMANNEFNAASVPGNSLGAMYQQKLADLMTQVTTLQATIAEQQAMKAAAQAQLLAWEASANALRAQQAQLAEQASQADSEQTAEIEQKAGEAGTRLQEADANKALLVANVAAYDGVISATQTQVDGCLALVGAYTTMLGLAPPPSPAIGG